jgi:hypothetical protein
MGYVLFVRSGGGFWSPVSHCLRHGFFLNEISNTESKSGMFFAVASLEVGMYCTRSGFHVNRTYAVTGAAAGVAF